MIGADGSTYTPPGEWQFNVSARTLRSTDHYSTDVEQIQRQTQGTYVINNQHAIDVNLTRQMTRRVSLSIAVPFIDASWSIPAPRTPTLGPRAVENGTGLGDITGAVRTWVFDPRNHPTGNFIVGVGLKLPTGKADAMDTFVDINGQDSKPRYVDQSVQPGDGGWGITTDISAFKLIKRTMIFGSGSYLINPRDTNATPSILVNLGVGNLTTPNNVNRLVNSVPDQYMVRAGASTSIGKGFGASLAWRVEGMPRYDLIGRSDGFRRPGLEMFIEPGISYSWGKSSFTYSMPWGYYRNRKPDAYTGALGDATFPRFIILGAYSVKFGGPKAATLPAPGTVSSATNAAMPGGAAATLARPTTARGQELVEMAITGMTCEDCVSTVQSALRNARGVVSADVSIAQQRAVVVYEPKKTTIAELEKAVNNAKGMNPYTAKADTATVTLAVSGMTCEQCADAVRTALASVEGVADAKVSAESNTAVVTYQPSKTKVKSLLDAVKNAKGMNAYTAKVVEE